MITLLCGNGIGPDGMEQSLSSEEKLLHVIRKKGSSEFRKEAANKNKVEGKGYRWQILRSFLTINRVLLLATGILFLAILMKISQKPRDTVKLKESDHMKAGTASLRIELFKKTKPLDEYMAEIAKRDLFELPWEKPMQEGTGVQQPTTATQSELSQVLKVTGIVLDKNPTVIIEDTRAQQTYFLNVGDEVMGAKLKEIDADKAVFQLNGQRIELTP